MAQVINSNIPSLGAQNSLNRTNTGLTQALERLSSGKRINSAKDDAAGIAIVSRFTAQIRGYNQGTRNAADAISLAQTAEGAYDEMSSNMQRIRELAIQSANATNSSVDRAALNTEVQQLKAEILRVQQTEFNGVAVIGASAQAFAFQVGPNAGGNNVITVTTTSVDATLGGVAATNGVSTVTAANTMITTVDTALAALNSQRANLGAVQNRFESVIRNGENASLNLSASRSRIEDADFAAETANLTKYQILQQAGTSVLSQANALPQSVLGLLG
ncbi:MAG: flagellin FliC [gamma proteobacterium symbiont of Taylorina sp.]|nr:flagellin FliC [gamma proteobacterium symbiont of Taylorina sp.]